MKIFGMGGAEALLLFLMIAIPILIIITLVVIIIRTRNKSKNTKRGLNAMEQPPVPATSDADEIMKFKNLLDQGIISPEEFDAKKKQLLGL